MGHDHDHHHVSLSTGGRHVGRLVIVLALTGGFLVVEFVTALATNSLALLSDAGHMLTDVVGLAMALGAILAAQRHARRNDPGSHTYGLYRLEILAALVNALLLYGIAIYVVIEAIGRIGHGADVVATPMLIVATLGLVVNVVAYLLLREGAKESLNLEGAALEVLADTVGSIGVIIAAILVHTLGWVWADTVFAIAIGAWILPRATRLAGRALRILLQAAPAEIDPEIVHSELAAIDAVVDVHDLHIWTLTSGMDSLTAHLMVHPGTDTHGVLDAARDLLETQYGIDHATLQIEPTDHAGCDEVGW